MQHTVYGDAEGDDIPSHKKAWHAIKAPLIVVYKRILRPLWELFRHRVWIPFYLHLLMPAWDYIKETEAFRRFVAVYRRVKRCFIWTMETFCPCLCWCFRKRHAAKRVIESLSPTSLQRQWQSGDNSPRKMALELRRRIETGELSPRSLKAELAKRYARGELSPRSFKNRMNELQKALSDSPRATKIAEKGGVGLRLLRVVGWKPKDPDQSALAELAEGEIEEGAEEDGEAAGTSPPGSKSPRATSGEAAGSPRGGPGSPRGRSPSPGAGQETGSESESEESDSEEEEEDEGEESEEEVEASDED